MTHSMKTLLAAAVLTLAGCAPALGSGLGPGSDLPSDLFSAPAVSAPGSVVTSTRAFGPGADIPSTFTGTGGEAEVHVPEAVAWTTESMLQGYETAAPRGVFVSAGGL
ncbi:MAG: hypothetical protein AB8I08_07955 [Sandaracinaceae bacterium]